MCRKILMFSVLGTLLTLVSPDQSLYGLFKQLNDTEKNESEFINEIFKRELENETNDNYFWLAPELNDTTKNVTFQDSEFEGSGDVSNITLNENEIKNGTHAEDNTLDDASTVETVPTEMIQSDNEINETKNTLLNESDPQFSLVDEKIVLQRMHCDLEIAVQEGENLKIQIKFQKLQNNTSGKCWITLNGAEMLGILISNIHLYHNGSEAEVLQVITSNQGSAFVFKEYYYWSKYEPLLLTETNLVHLVLYYKVTTVLEKENDSYFDLEVIPYNHFKNFVTVEHDYNNRQPDENNYLKPESMFYYPYVY